MKYKIAYIMHKAGTDTYGGFPQHVELSIYGLKQLGHDVDFYFISGTTQDGEVYYQKKLQQYQAGEFTIRGQVLKRLDKGIGTGYYYSAGAGWICPITPVGRLDQKEALKEKLETYDAVFWHTPFWFKQKLFQTDTDWPMLLDLKNPVNIGFHHDGNIRANSAWMVHIDEYFDKLISVHPASYNACAVFRTPRCMIFNPQFIDYDVGYSGFRNFERPMLFSLQCWKASKHVDDLIRAVPHFKRDISTVIGGNGIEYDYMHSKDKIKMQYLVNRKLDPDALTENIDTPIIELARQHGVKTVRWLNTSRRDWYFSKASFFVDTAWYRVNKLLGAHFSRTLIESMIHGVVPIARNYGLGRNEDGTGDIFVPGVNYLMIPHNATPKQFADRVDEFFEMDERQYNEIVSANYKMLKHFDIIHVAKQYVDVIQGTPTGYYNKYETGKPTRAILNKADKQWFSDGTKRSFSFEKRKKATFF